MILQKGDLTYVPQSRTFVCEVSDLQGAGIRFDENVVIEDAERGKKIEMAYVGKNLSNENEILGWVWHSVRGSKFPVKLEVFND